MTEREKMLAGQLYDPGDKELTALRVKAHNLCRQLNALGEEDPGREPLFRALLGKLGVLLRNENIT